MKIKNRIRFFEYIHIPLWLIKDACWAMQFKPLGVLMIFPTVYLALLISIKTYNDKFDFFQIQLFYFGF
jgi:hypothetical protein